MSFNYESGYMQQINDEAAIQESLARYSHIAKRNTATDFRVALYDFKGSHDDLLALVTDLATHHGPGRTRRFLRGVREISRVQGEEFDLNEYYRLFRLAHKRFGGDVAEYFVRGLPRLCKIEKTPEEYFEAIDLAVEAGGRKFARYYTSTLPWVWEKGGSAGDYRSAGMLVLQQAPFRIATSCLWCMPEVMEVVKIPQLEFAQDCVSLYKRLGEDVAYWGIRGFAGGFAYGFNAKEYSDDIQEVLDQYGVKSAGWYASGFRGICKLLKNRLVDVKRWQEKIAATEEEQEPFWGTTKAEVLEQRRRFLQYSQDTIAAVRNIRYKQMYIDLLSTLGQGSASLFVNTLNLAQASSDVRDIFTETIDYETRTINALPDELKETARTLEKKHYGKVVWLGFEIPRTIKDSYQYLQDAQNLYKLFGPEVLFAQLRTTRKIRKYGPRFFKPGIIYPKEQDIK